MRLGFASAGLLIWTFVGIAQAAGSGTFNNSAICGTYVVSLSGHGQPVLQPIDPSETPTSGVVQAVAGIGLLTFDGNGSITSGNIFVNANGDFGHGTSISVNAQPGSYSVSSDGTCTISIPTGGFNNILQFEWSCVVESSDRVLFVGQPTNTTVYALIEGTLTKQHNTQMHH